MRTLQQGRYAIDAAHTSVEFAVRHLMISTVKGRFGDVQGTVELDAEGRPRVDVTIRAASVDTRSEQRDAHLRSADFLDAERYPELRFVSTSAQRAGAEWTLEGDLSIRGVTRRVVLAVTEEGAGVDPWGNEKIAFTASGKISRGDFGLNWNAALETGGVLVGDEVRIAIDVQLAKQLTAQAA